MLYYDYSSETLELLGDGQEADLDPIEQKPMLPALATFIEPPVDETNKIQIFNEDDETWSVDDDFRGTDHFDSSGFHYIINDIGETVPVDHTTETPPDSVVYYTISNGSWETKPIEDVREMKINDAYRATVSAMDDHLSKYSKGEMDTWSKMNDECLLFQADGTVGPLMTSKTSSSPIYDTPEKLATMTVTEYQNYINGKYNLEGQRDQHKININDITDVGVLIDYDTSVSL